MTFERIFIIFIRLNVLYSALGRLTLVELAASGNNNINNNKNNVSSNRNNDNNDEFPKLPIAGCVLVRRTASTNNYELKCDEYDSLESFPRLEPSLASQIYEISIRKQPRLTVLRINDLKHFQHVTNFTVIDSGLKFVEILNTKNAFEPVSNSLRSVDLSDNKFEYFDWRWFTNFRHLEVVNLANNPLTCNCSLYWLASWTLVNRPKSFESPLGGAFDLTVSKLVRFPHSVKDVERLRCRDADALAADNGNPTLIEWASKSTACSLSRVDVSPKIVDVWPGDNVTFSCLIQTSGTLNRIRNGYFRTVHYNVFDRSATVHRLSVDQVSGHEDGSSQHSRITVSRVTSGNMGWYICVGMTDAGPSFDVAALAVRAPPRVNLISVSGPPQSGREISFLFEIFGYPDVNVTWWKNDEPVPFNKSLPYFPIAYYVTEFSKTDRLSKFYIRQVMFHMKHEYYTYSYYKANYTLTACNSVGCDETEFGENINESYWPQVPLPPRPQIPPLSQTLAATEKAAVAASDSEPVATEPNLVLVTVIVVCASFGLTVCSISLVCLLKKRKNDKIAQNNSRRNAKDLRALLGAADTFPLTNYSTNVVYQPVLSSDVPLIQRENLELIKEIGEGAFGKVYSAARFNASGNGDKTPVAVKCLKNVTVERCEEFAREAELMAKLNHPHVVTFYGVCLENFDNNLLLLFEYMDLGDLKHFLAARGPDPELIGAAGGAEPLTGAQLVSIAMQVVSGLNYLHQKHFVHRDLACRNCLCKNPLIVKLSDFGMSRDIYSSDYYRLARKAPLPVRWLPPESLVYGKFTSHSDVWSYGVVLWEIFSYGVTPWCQYSNMEVLQQVTSGSVLPKPDACLDELYTLMLSCWKKIPNERPTSQNILDTLTTTAATLATETAAAETAATASAAVTVAAAAATAAATTPSSDIYILDNLPSTNDNTDQVWLTATIDECAIIDE